MNLTMHGISFTIKKERYKMDKVQLEKMRNENGFIAALDQSGGSTPKALKAYGVTESAYRTTDEMFDLVHQMRTRIITSPAFDASYILGAILFEQTMDSKIDGVYTAKYLKDQKGILPFLKVDKGLEEELNGVQLMKPLSDLPDLLARAKEHGIFGTKMRSVIKANNPAGIKDIVTQQFIYGKQIINAGLVPILEPEVDIHSEDKEGIEELLRTEMLHHLNQLTASDQVMLKLTIPSKADLYQELMDHPNVIRVVALSGGYSRSEANELLQQNNGLIASFSRALSQDLHVDQTDQEFNEALEKAVTSIYEASV